MHIGAVHPPLWIVIFSRYRIKHHSGISTRRPQKSPSEHRYRRGIDPVDQQKTITQSILATNLGVLVGFGAGHGSTKELLAVVGAGIHYDRATLDRKGTSSVSDDASAASLPERVWFPAPSAYARDQSTKGSADRMLLGRRLAIARAPLRSSSLPARSHRAHRWPARRKRCGHTIQ